jgi:N-acetyl-anhydromuramyl-L-alanine amidase AmpD
MVYSPGTVAPRHGDEIIAAGKFIHTGTRVVLWTDPGGYDAYRVERRFSPLEDADWESTRNASKDLETPNRYGMRRSPVLTAAQLEQVRGGGWDLPLLQQVVDQFVLHYDACGTSRQCFKVLHDLRGLSVHFLLDLDGTIYQTLDLKERAWHATTSNTRSIGIEIAHIGAYNPHKKNPLELWYQEDPDGRTQITIPKRFDDGGLRTPHFIGRPLRPKPVTGVIQAQELTQYDFTPQQYKALAKLGAALCRTFPQLKCNFPRDDAGQLVICKLPEATLSNYQGFLGHFHIQTNKVDPGPAFQWQWMIDKIQRYLKHSRRSSTPSKGGEALQKLQCGMTFVPLFCMTIGCHKSDFRDWNVPSLQDLHPDYKPFFDEAAKCPNSRNEPRSDGR